MTERTNEPTSQRGANEHEARKGKERKERKGHEGNGSRKKLN
jgi:hypothetical protein